MAPPNDGGDTEAHALRRSLSKEAAVAGVAESGGANVAAESSEVQEHVVHGDTNPHLAILQHHRLLQQRAALEAAEAKQKEVARQKARAAQHQAPAALPTYRSMLNVLEGKQWVSRSVMLRDDVVPALLVFPADAPEQPDGSTKLQEILLSGAIDVGDYFDAPAISGRLTLRKAAPRPHAFTLIVGDRSYGFEAADADAKATWLDKIHTFVLKLKLKEAAPVANAPAGKLLPTYRASLSVLDKKNWVQRTVVLQDGVVPVIGIYPDVANASEAVPAPDARLLEIKLQGSVTVGDYITATDLSGRLTLRKVQPRPAAFTVIVNDKQYHFDCPTAEEKQAWLDHICSYIVRYRLNDTRVTTTLPLKKLLPSYNSYLGVQEKGTWVARLVVLRDGPQPSVSIYDAASKIPPDEDMLVREIPLAGFVEIGDFRASNEGTGRLTLRVKSEPRPNSFTLLVNDKAYGFDAPNPTVKNAWMGRLFTYIERYRLNENVPVNTDTLAPLTGFLRKMRVRDSHHAASANPNHQAGTSAQLPPKLNSLNDFNALPDEVMEPIAPEEDLNNQVFHNQLFGQDL